VMQAGEGRELATERVLVLRGPCRRELLQGEVVTGPMPILDEPDPSGPALTEDSLHPITVA